MRFPDVNVWLALTFQSHENHAAAKRWFDSIDSDPILFCRQTQQGFLRLATNVKAFGEEAVTMKEAWQLYGKIRSDSRIAFLAEPEKVETTWKGLTDLGSRSPKLWNDAWLAAFAMEQSLQLVTFDTGFKQFVGLHHLILSPSQ